MPDLTIDTCKEIHRELAACRDCGLPCGYGPRIYPPGPHYRKGGTVFMQINPGHISSMDEAAVLHRYKRSSSREKALRKIIATRRLIKLQDAFVACPAGQVDAMRQCYRKLQSAYQHDMAHVWGWPPGKYGHTIHAHGADLASIAVLNLAQCPVPGDAYRRAQLEHCWSQWTRRLLELLAPSQLVAQGRQVRDFLKRHELPSGITVIPGVHHASRESRTVRDTTLAAARRLIAP